MGDVATVQAGFFEDRAGDPLYGFNGLVILVPGTPAPQGSHRSFKAKSGAIVTKDDNPHTQPWKAAVTAAAAKVVKEAGLPNPAYGREPVGISVTFRLARPKGHYGTKGLLPSASKYPVVTPDLDKLARAILDALTGIVYRDDSQVVALDVYKRYADELVTTIEVSVAT